MNCHICGRLEVDLTGMLDTCANCEHFFCRRCEGMAGFAGNLCAQCTDLEDDDGERQPTGLKIAA